ncbi:uncharacterized protein LOC108843924 [Raphanus sativus]|uniref:Uncharacterized protein LOC108843924 n=1 Tax=Raphanus sativus TaxID=3726 RepID=A0A6J0MJA2_RAPSA|nr:uncharacterized protein LOC108843924 [Raphanus sativus]
MEKREPSLVPEWLRSTGNGSSVGSKNHILSSSARSDSSLLLNNNKSRSPFLDRSCSTNPRRGSARNAYSNFNVQRSNRDKDRSSREKDIDPWDHDTCFPFGTFFNEEQLRRFNSMTTRKQDDPLSQGFSMGFSDGRSFYNRNGILPAKTSQGGPDVVRISSPALSQNLTAGEGWTSALAEVPIVIDRSASESVAASVVTSNTITGQTRNMAEAVSQPRRTGTPPQGSSKIQRVEDRTLKLIPVLPSTPKGSVLSSSDKSKTKPMARSGEIGLASFRNTHQHSSIRLGNLPSNSGSQIKPDTTKKMVVLKPAVKESASPRPINNTLAAASQMIAAPSAPSTTSAQSTNNPRELKGALVNIPPEKKLSLPQTQSKSRSAFFSSLKKKTSTNISTSDCIISSVEENEDISKELVASDPSSVETDDIVMERVEKVSEADPSSVETDDIVMERVEKVSEAAERVSVFEPADLPDGEEAEFLKSLGWDENNTEVVEAITEEEIKAFYEENKEVKPSLMQTLPIIKEATEDATPNS